MRTDDNSPTFLKKTFHFFQLLPFENLVILKLSARYIYMSLVSQLIEDELLLPLHQEVMLES